MATTSSPISMAASTRGAEKRGVLWTVLLPSLPDLVFVAFLAWLFAAGEFGWMGLLSDGDTGWHIRTGEFILDHWRVPTLDLFSSSKAGAPWFAWEWGADVLFALLFRAGGLKLLVLASAAVICLTITLLFLRQLKEEVNLFLALLLTGLAAGASSIHYLARPHIFTLALLPLSLWIIERDRRKPDRLVWVLIPMTIIWTSLHGGFVALIVCLVLLTLGAAAEFLLGAPGNRGWKGVIRYAGLTGGCSLATLINPYGYQLHLHVAKYLNSDWIRGNVQEFQSPQFRGETALQYELLLLAGVIVAGMLLSRKKVVEALWILCWAHFSLSGARHIPIYAVVALPVVAREMNRWWDRATLASGGRSLAGICRAVSADISASSRKVTVLPLLVLILLPVLDHSSRWPTDFPSKKFPVNIVKRNEALLRNSNSLTMDQWGDYLIFRFYPSQKVYIDGRSDFYGAGIGEEYKQLMAAGENWRRIVDERGFQVALLPADWPLVSAMKSSSDWKLLEKDDIAYLFVKVIGLGTGRVQDPALESSISD